jgi:nicotinamide N-methyltransferase
VVITDHPDPSILNNLQKSVNANRALLRPDMDIKVVGYEWGANPEPILALCVRFGQLWAPEEVFLNLNWLL